jgi:hypothetical protein
MAAEHIPGVLCIKIPRREGCFERWLSSAWAAKISFEGKSLETRHRRADHSRLQESAEGAQAMLPPSDTDELKREISWRVWLD